MKSVLTPTYLGESTSDVCWNPRKPLGSEEADSDELRVSSHTEALRPQPDFLTEGSWRRLPFWVKPNSAHRSSEEGGAHSSPVRAGTIPSRK